MSPTPSPNIFASQIAVPSSMSRHTAFLYVIHLRKFVPPLVKCFTTQRTEANKYLQVKISLSISYQFISQFHVNILEIQLLFCTELKCVLSIKCVFLKSQYSLILYRFIDGAPLNSMLIIKTNIWNYYFAKNLFVVSLNTMSMF